MSAKEVGLPHRPPRTQEEDISLKHKTLCTTSAFRAETRSPDVDESSLGDEWEIITLVDDANRAMTAGSIPPVCIVENLRDMSIGIQLIHIIQATPESKSLGHQHNDDLQTNDDAAMTEDLVSIPREQASGIMDSGEHRHQSEATLREAGTDLCSQSELFGRHQS